jgi:Leucine-rich repeat (LRR) protein
VRTGRLPKELGKLVNLAHLDLSRTMTPRRRVSAVAFYQNIGSSKRLTVGNRARSLTDLCLSGTIPKELGKLTNLKELYLHQNQLTGSLPKELGSLVNLIVLSLWGNQLSGRVPQEIRRLTKLKSLGLGHNVFSGSVPKELGELAQLTYLNLSGNQLTGVNRVAFKLIIRVV